MFFSHRAFNVVSSSSRCSGDNSFLLLTLLLFVMRRYFNVFQCALVSGFFKSGPAFPVARSFFTGQQCQHWPPPNDFAVLISKPERSPYMLRSLRHRFEDLLAVLFRSCGS